MKVLIQQKKHSLPVFYCYLIYIDVTGAFMYIHHFSTVILQSCIFQTASSTEKYHIL